MKDICFSFRRARNRFISFIYRNKRGELARYVVLPCSYTALRARAVAKLKTLKLTGIDDIARKELVNSLDTKGVSKNYTKKDHENPCGGEVYVNNVGEENIKGMIISRKVLEKGEPKKQVNSSPKTLAKNKLRKLVKLNKWIQLNASQVLELQGNKEKVIF